MLSCFSFIFNRILTCFTPSKLKSLVEHHPKQLTILFFVLKKKKKTFLLSLSPHLKLLCEVLYIYLNLLLRRRYIWYHLGVNLYNIRKENRAKFITTFIVSLRYMKRWFKRKKKRYILVYSLHNRVTQNKIGITYRFIPSQNLSNPTLSQSNL